VYHFYKRNFKENEDYEFIFKFTENFASKAHKTYYVEENETPYLIMHFEHYLASVNLKTCTYKSRKFQDIERYSSLAKSNNILV
jgi:hypothetical protein